MTCLRRHLSETPETLQAVSPGMAQRKWNAAPHTHTPLSPSPTNPLPVSCRLTQTWLALNYPVSAPLSFSPLSLSLSSAPLCVCVCVHSEERAEKKDREGSGGRAGWRAPTKKRGSAWRIHAEEHEEFPEGALRRCWISLFCVSLHLSGAGDLSFASQR